MVDISNSEILQIIESVAKEKGLSREDLIHAMEQAIAAAGRKRYGNDANIQAEINRKNGDIRLYRVQTVVEKIEEDEQYTKNISLEHALKQNPDAKLGDKIYDPLSSIDLGRVAAQAAKQEIIQRVNEVERIKQYNTFKDRVGEVLTCSIKRIEFGNIIVNWDGVEAIIKKDQLIKNETYKINDLIKAYVQAVRLESKGPLIFLSRIDNQMLAKLFENNVPEIYDNIIEIKAIARDPGSRAKIAVFAADTSIDAVGSCVGIKGNRVKAVISELNGEKIDIIQWNKDISQFIINAMKPVDVSKIMIDADNNMVEIVVPDDQLSLAIGKRGQNIRLVSKLAGCKIDVMTEEQQASKRDKEFAEAVTLFTEGLDVEEEIAKLLAYEGYSSVEEIVSSGIAKLTEIPDFSEELAMEIHNRASNYLNQIEAKNEDIVTKLEELGVEQELLDILTLKPDEILTLAEYGIKTLEDLAEIDATEFKKLLPNTNLSDHEIKILLKKGSI